MIVSSCINYLFVLDLLFDAIDRVGGLDIQGDGLPREGLHEDLWGENGDKNGAKYLQTSSSVSAEGRESETERTEEGEMGRIKEDR